MSAAVNNIGAVCFGVVTGYITYRTLVRTVSKAAISDLAAVLSSVGGAAVIKLYTPGSAMFACYSFGLLIGMAVFFVLFYVINGRAATGTVMGAPTRQEGAELPRPAQGGPRA